ncbi:hypothetical protein HXX76_002356 [Chlamydomonas incerta]|uniref:Uncharacterized protein n=1 Tax=Chlamydomonas incerta TaxID=51695 RepID=A0A835TBB6_CHLIN|nr:hypothetical protein HXX76_002356 [Chlamydomonas incerta]|eukprot:KAG2442269.1 hypothetical protein HXX76_002356 [Chlamydomonas incerta]
MALSNEERQQREAAFEVAKQQHWESAEAAKQQRAAKPAPAQGGGCQHLQPAALSAVAILAAIIYALKCFVAYSAVGSWSRTNLQLVRRDLGVWAAGLPSQLLLRIMDLAVVLGDVCFTGGSAGSGEFAAGMKAAKLDVDDPSAVARAKGERRMPG